MTWNTLTKTQKDQAFEDAKELTKRETLNQQEQVANNKTNEAAGKKTNVMSHSDPQAHSKGATKKQGGAHEEAGRS